MQSFGRSLSPPGPPRRCRQLWGASLSLALAVLAGCGGDKGEAKDAAMDVAEDPAGNTITVMDASPLNWLSVTWNTMEELVRVDKDGKTSPTLATSWKWIDPRTVEFKLREGVVFQDGEKFTAPVFRRSFDEVQRWDNPHPPGAFLNFAKNTKLEVVDDYTVRFVFPEPDAAALMKFRGMHVGSTKFWETNAFVDKKSGTAEAHW